LIYFSHNFYILYLIVSTTIFYAWFILGFWACPLLSFASAQEAGVGLCRGSVLVSLGPAAFAAALPIPHAEMPFHSTNYPLNLSFSLDLIHLLIRIGVFFLITLVIVIHKKYSMIFNGINYSKEFSPQPKNDCTQRGTYQRINPDGDADPGILFDTDWSTHITHTQVLNEISHYEQALAAADSSWQSANAQVQSIQDTLDEWIKYALFRSEKVGDSSLAIQALMPLPAFKYQKKLVGVYLEEEMYNEAESLLSSMNTEDIPEALFIEVQETNLRHLNGESLDSIDYADIKRLKEITYEPYPAAGFAYGLYYKLTGKLLELPLDTPGYIFQTEPIATSAEPLNSAKKSFVFPNPASTDIVIKSNQAFSALEIYSVNGTKVVEKEFGETSNYKFQSSELPSGLYIIQLSNKRRLVDRIKFVKQ